MVLPLGVVAWAFSIAAAFCLIDAFLARPFSRQLFRGFQCAAFALAAWVYWRSAILHASIPSPEIRFALLMIIIFSIYEIISRWSIGGQRK